MNAQAFPARWSHLARWLTALALLFFVVSGAHAAKVNATLSSANASVGEEVTYEIQIEGGSPDQLPHFPKLDGVEVDFGGRNSSFSIINGATKQSVGYLYHLTPKREGTVEIPPIEIIVDGQKFTTQAMTLKVAPPEKAAAVGDIAYGEINVVRQPVYVGEDVIVELRYYLDLDAARWSFSGAQMPVVEGEGFSTRGIISGDQSDVHLGGKRYFRFPFRAAISPNRAGKITIGPINFQVPISKRVGTRNDPFGMVFERTQAFTVTAPALTLEVKPLPTEGRPKDFSGAIGSFRFNGQGSPTRVKAGDPVTMTFQVDGTGNFDRVSAPTLADTDGWRAYKATDKFEPTDKLGTSGRKTFEVAVVPEVKKTAMPIFNFSYFDPEKAKYFTLTNSPAPLEVEGGAPATAAPDATAAAASKPKAAPDDILGIRPTLGFWGVGWQPRLSVWLALLMAPAPFIAFALLWRARRADPRIAIRSALLREKSLLLSRLRNTADRAELFDAAARILQIDVALVTGLPAGGIDEANILARCDSGAVKKMYAARAELVYAGEIGGKVTVNERDQVLDAVAEFERRSR